MIRGKLIGPTNILLEHPLLSPVRECEYFLIGKTEYEKNRRDWVRYGALFGAAGMSIVFAFIQLLVMR